jgi:hypothetical protein
LIGLLLAGWVAWRDASRGPVSDAPEFGGGEAAPAEAARANRRPWPRPREDDEPGVRDRAAEVTGGDADVSLLLMERPEEETGRTWGLARYRFRRGKLLRKDFIPVSSPDASRPLAVFWPRPFVRNRYVLTWGGDVIDAATGRALRQESDSPYGCLGLDGDKVVTFISMESGAHVFKTFDPGTLREETLREPGRWELPGVRSPGKTASADALPDGRLYLYRLDGREELLGTGFRFEESIQSLLGAPLLWLDDDRILTQTSNGHLVIVGTDGTVEPFLDFPRKPPVGRPRLFRDREGPVVYYDGAVARAIDVKGRKSAPYRWFPLGNGFDCEYHQNQDYGHIVRYNGREIGRLWCNWWGAWCDAVTARGYLAMSHRPDGAGSHGVKVWAASSGDWTVIPSGPGYAHLIAWTNGSRDE